MNTRYLIHYLEDQSQPQPVQPKKQVSKVPTNTQAAGKSEVATNTVVIE